MQILKSSFIDLIIRTLINVRNTKIVDSDLNLLIHSCNVLFCSLVSLHSTLQYESFISLADYYVSTCKRCSRGDDGETVAGYYAVLVCSVC